MTSLLYILLYSLIAAILFAILLKKSIVYIPAEYEWVIERYNKFHRIARPPFAFVFFDPYFDRIRKKIFMRGDTHEITVGRAYTKDRVSVDVYAKIYFKVVDAYKATYEIPDYFAGIERQAKSYIRAKVATMIVDELLTGRGLVKAHTEELLTKDMESWGLHLSAVEITNVEIPEELKKALEDKAIAEKQAKADMIRAENALKVAKKEAETHKIKLEEKIHMIEELAKVNPSKDSNMPINILLGEKYIDALAKLSKSDSSKFVVYPSDLQKSLKGLFTMSAMKEDSDD